MRPIQRLASAFVLSFFTCSLLSACAQDDNAPLDCNGLNDETLAPDGDTIEAERADTLEEEIAEEGGEPPDSFYFLALADTHIIDDFYRGPEGNLEDSVNIFRSRRNLAQVIERVKTMDYPIELGFIAGDFIHNYPSNEWSFFFQNKTRIDHAKALAMAFPFPMLVGLGNHDYAVKEVSQAFTNRLFAEKLGIEPYYVVERHGFKFFMLNNFLGDTWNPASEDYGKGTGSFGRAQLMWLDESLADGKPAFLVTHFSMMQLAKEEYPDLSFFTILEKYKDTILMVFTGHLHRWMDVSQYPVKGLGLGSTRYDEDAFALVKVDTFDWSVEILNEDCFHYFSVQTDRFDAQTGACTPNER